MMGSAALVCVLSLLEVVAGQCWGQYHDGTSTCDEAAIAGYGILIALSCLLFLLAAFLAAYVRCKKKKDETYAAAACRVLCRRGTKVRAVAPTTSEEAPVVRVVDAEGIAPNELGTVVAVEQPPANQR